MKTTTDEQKDDFQRKFVLCSVFNILWNFLLIQGLLALFLMNLSILVPSIFPAGHVFVLDSAEYIEEIYYYGSGPEEIDDNYIKEQRHLVDSRSA